MMVNTEWGAFDNVRDVLPTTPFDSKVDRESINPRFQAYEKFLSGMYLGEITRNILLALIDAAPKPILFNGKSTERLNKHYGLDTEVLSLVEGAWRADAPREGVSEEEEEEENAALRDFSAPLVEERIAPATLRRLNKVREVVQEHLGFAPGEVSLRDAALVQWAAALVVRRAARLSACGIATVALQMGYVTGLGKDARAAAPSTERKPYSIGIDGRWVSGLVFIGRGLARLMHSCTWRVMASLIACISIILVLRNACARRCGFCLAKRSRSWW